MKKLIFHIVCDIIALWVAVKFIPGVYFEGGILIIILFGALLGFANSFLRPILRIILLPLTIITFGLFSLIINMFLIWLVIDVLSPIQIIGFLPLLLTTVLIWVINVSIGQIFK